MKRILINSGYIAKKACYFVGCIYAVLGFIAMFVPLDEILSEKTSIFIRIIISLSILLGLWVLCFIAISIAVFHTGKIKILPANNGHALYLQYGDVFRESEVLYPDERRNIVIPVNRCFDTIVDNRLVSDKTLHGIVCKRFFGTGNYTEESLNNQIQSLLSNIAYEELSINEKPAGNRKRFPLGTVVDIALSDKEHYFLWALSSFDSNLKAQTAMQDYVVAVQKLIEACNAESEGFPVVLPLVGAGLSRTKKDQKDILSYLINAFKINRNEINSDIHIVVQGNLKTSIPILSMK